MTTFKFQARRLNTSTGRKYASVLFCSLLHLLPLCIQAQGDQQGRVSGKVLDASSGEGLPGGTVVLLNPTDSSMVTGTSTEGNGEFNLEASYGTYLVEVRFIGYKAHYIEGVQLDEESPHHEIGTVRLEPENRKTDEVTVEGERSEMTMEEGKKVFNVGSDLSSSGANASDVLDNIPSVEMDEMEGEISLRGSQGVRVLVNGKPSSMMGISGPEALRYFPANKIERVEVITNPSAKYEAQGSAGIINIILKEELDWGLNGNFTLETGYPHDHGASVNMNYRKKWYNIIGNFNAGYQRAPGGGWREQHFEYPDTTYSLRTDEDQSRGGLEYSAQLGSEFYFTPNDVLKISGVYSVGDEENYTDLRFYDHSGATIRSSNLVQRTRRDELEKEEEGDHELNLSYEKTFGEEDHELTLDLQARQSVEVEDAELIETQGLQNEAQDTNLFQESLNSTDVTGYMGRLDYTWPFSEDGKLETGLRAEKRNIRNLFNVRQRPSGSDPWNTLDQFSNIFHYQEEIYGAYALYRDQIGDLGYQGGLRYEYTGIGTRLEGNEDRGERSYSNLFPSLSVTYNIDDTNSVQASYSRRINRPYFRELNPYNTFNNNRVYSTGNPELDPEFTGAYDLGYTHYRQDGSFYVGAFYRKTLGEIEDVDTINDEGVTIVKPYNLSSRDNIGIETRYSHKIYDWWNASITAHFFHGSTSGFAAGEDLNNQAFTMDGRVRFDFDVKDWFEFQVNADYRAPEREGQDIEKAMYEINAGVRKSILDNKGNISFSVRDMFNTDVYRARTMGSNFRARRRFQWRRGPFFSLSFSYELDDKDAEKSEEGSIFEEDRG